MSGTKHLRGNYGISGGGGRESSYLPRRDELAWDLDKRETWGGGGSRSWDRGEQSQVSGGRERRRLQECGFKGFYLGG